MVAAIDLDIYRHPAPSRVASEDRSAASISQAAKLLANGCGQAVRLPGAYRFDSREVLIRRNPQTGDLKPSRTPATWDDFSVALKEAEIPADFLTDSDRAFYQVAELDIEDWTK